MDPIKIDIFRGQNIIATIECDDRTERRVQLGSEDVFAFEVFVRNSLLLQKDDYFIHDGFKYKFRDENTELQSEIGYTSRWIMSGPIHDLSAIKVNHLLSYSPSFFGNLIEHCQFLLYSIIGREEGNQPTIDPEWNIDTSRVTESTAFERISITYDSTTVLSAYNQVMNVFKHEFHVIGKTIIVAKTYDIRPATLKRFEVGRHKGLYTLEEKISTDKRIITRIIPRGGSNNLPLGYEFPNLQLSGPKPWVEKNVDIYGDDPEIIDYPKVFPRLKDAKILSDAIWLGTQSSGEPLIDIPSAPISPTIPTPNTTDNPVGENRLWEIQLSAEDVPFDLNDTFIEGQAPIIQFNTGDCAGYPFEIINWDNATKKLQFQIYEDNRQGQTFFLPFIISGSHRYPKAGDVFVFLGIKMDASYTIKAQAELRDAAMADLEKYCVKRPIFTLTTDNHEMRRRSIDIQIGEVVEVSKSEIYELRVIGYRHPITDTYEKTITIADEVTKPAIVSLQREQENQQSQTLDLLTRQEQAARLIANIANFGALPHASSHSEGGSDPLLPHAYTHHIGGNDYLDPNSIGAFDFRKGGPIGNYTPGALGGGAYIGQDGNAEFESIMVRGAITATRFTVNEIEAIMGSQVISAAQAIITRIEELPTYFKCYYIPKGGLGQVWRVGDQARCNDGLRAYFCLVVAISDEANEDGEWWYALSKTDYAWGIFPSPAVNDLNVLFGHRGIETYRQSVRITSTGADNSIEGYYPYEAVYVGINNYYVTSANEIKWEGRNVRHRADTFTLTSRGGISTPIIIDRGIWQPGTYHKDERVSHNGNMWRCLITTQAEPTDISNDWLKEIDIQIGGTNLALNTAGTHHFLSGYWIKEFLITFTPQVGELLTLSWEDLVQPQSGGYGINVFLWAGSWDTAITLIWMHTGTGRHSVTVQIPSNISSAKYSLMFYSNDSTGGSITNVKLERGNQATSWSPAPEDVPNALKETGINISTGRIDINAQNTFIGNRTLITSDGLIRGDRLEMQSANVTKLAAVEGTIGDMLLSGGSLSMNNDNKIMTWQQDNIPTLSELVGGIAESLPYDAGAILDISTTYTILNEFKRSWGSRNYSKPIILTFSSINIPFEAQYSAVGDGIGQVYMRASLNLMNTITGARIARIATISNIDIDSGWVGYRYLSGLSDPQQFTIALPGGSYHMELQGEYGIQMIEGDGSGFIRLNIGNIINNAVYQTQVHISAPNGKVLYFANNAYDYTSYVDGIFTMEKRNGNYGWRLTANGEQRMNNGINWFNV